MIWGRQQQQQQLAAAAGPAGSKGELHLTVQHRSNIRC